MRQLLFLPSVVAFMCVPIPSAHSETPEQPATNRTAGVAVMKDRWFFSFGYGRNPSDVATIKTLVDVAAKHGLNGMVLSSFGLDGVSTWQEGDRAHLSEVAEHCSQRGIELIPTGFSVGYGGAALKHNRSFAAALPVVLPLQAVDGQLVPRPSANLLPNGDLNAHKKSHFIGYDFHDDPGQVSFVDVDTRSGNTSIRFENFGKFQHGHARLKARIQVEPGRMYRLRFKVKTEALEPAGCFKAIFHGLDDRTLTDVHPKVEPTQEWTQFSLDYINDDRKEVAIYVGVWGGESGRFWLDDLSVQEFGDLSEIPRRDGTPLELRSADRQSVFVEGKDFDPIECTRDPQPVKIPEGSSIRESENLELRCYKIPHVAHFWGDQISLCMSNPELYSYWQKEAKSLYEIIKFKRFLLSMDEIRNGGGCLTCKQSGLSMAQILGDCITRQYAILKALDPDMEVLIWSDMLDPAQNAHDNYYGVLGDFTDSWKYVPKDLIMMCWYHEIRDKSLAFFSREGFRTMGAAYYDGDDLSNPLDWIKSLAEIPRAQGIMYTTWEKKYELLGPFGDLIMSGTSPK
jgi:hypothetical protein